ncbi:hypothetical protein [Sediminitomix flava]|uniref:Uncharacterized protein n=1 Tax=Sediminitomix flava TaxID=379075 RepID=A0A315Z7R8_SEDFL|nr:hypothetical protein [Sediminitomix flava]PWJ40971.1 hypothetical protein BC781_104237 [Sediminitomix flava]
MNFDNQEEEGQYKLIYSYFGLAIYLGQGLEDTIANMVWIDRLIKKTARRDDLPKLIEAIEQSPVETKILTEEVGLSYFIPDAKVELINVVLNKKKYIGSKLFKVEQDKLYSEEGRKEVLEFLSSYIEEIDGLNDPLESYYDNYKDLYGVTQEKIAQLSDELDIE